MTRQKQAARVPACRSAKASRQRPRPIRLSEQELASEVHCSPRCARQRSRVPTRQSKKNNKDQPSGNTDREAQGWSDPKGGAFAGTKYEIRGHTESHRSAIGEDRGDNRSYVFCVACGGAMTLRTGKGGRITIRRCVDTILTVTRSLRCVSLRFRSHPLVRKLLFPSQLRGLEPRVLARDRSRNFPSPFTGRFPFLASL